MSWTRSERRFAKPLVLCTSTLKGAYVNKVVNRVTHPGVSQFDQLKEQVVIVVDVNNVRGVGTGFQWSEIKLLALVNRWRRLEGSSASVVFVVDHGGSQLATLQDHTAVVFSGPGRTADDIIARDTHRFSTLHGQRVYVVTSDEGLRHRCAPFCEKIIGSVWFAALLESSVGSGTSHLHGTQSTSTENEFSQADTAKSQETVHEAKRLIKQLEGSRGVHKRKRLKRLIAKEQAKLAENALSNVADFTLNCAGSVDLAMLERLEDHCTDNTSSPHRERTRHRVQRAQKLQQIFDHLDRGTLVFAQKVKN
ncbi:hypothetical protein CYMTET_9782 [Cymbomonas tetramitiformis]|uniref:Uncharacterized protein n=1 Tax=Cymbomonas tetramitiformis TaxID=36881 RepID=A0AAE0LEN9_9CHLO|nr:hypothetical protein CYMTET_9782 [Cymbomonas tetramitiformis]